MAKSKEKMDVKSPASKKQQSFFIKTYLFGYNFIQVLGWSYLLYQIINYFTINTTNKDSLYDTVKCTVIIFQNAAVLEIFHAATKLVPSNPVITTFQVFSRVMVVCGVLMPTLEGRTGPGLPLALLAWSVTEIIRYLYYALNIANVMPHFLVWLRYTTFIILYPIGVTGELLCFYGAQNEVSKTDMWTIGLPNPLNFSFHYRHFLIFIMLLYIPLFPQMYLHMFSQRRKILGPQKLKAH